MGMKCNPSYFKQENKDWPSHFLQMSTSCKEPVTVVKIISAKCRNLLSLKQNVTLMNLGKEDKSLHTVCQVALH